MTMPAGMVLAWAGNNPPKGYLLCDGKSYRRSDFPDLFRSIGTIWGGDAVELFKVPDLRGRFLRGVDAGAGRDLEAPVRKGDDGSPIGDKPGSVQNDAMEIHRHNDSGHSHSYTTLLEQPGDDDQANQAWSQWSIDHKASYTTSEGHARLGEPVSMIDGSPVNIARETRPKNAYVYFIIKAVD
jgi:microcystin-dependent protein